MDDISLVLRILALALFIAAAVGAPGRFGYGWMGLALALLSFMV